MRQVRALLYKELLHHGWAALGLLVGLGLMLGLQALGHAASENKTSMLELIPSFLLAYIPLAAFFCAHRLVVVEYHGRTQLFLETLPIGRGRMVTIKFGLGCCVLALAGLAAVCLGIVLALRGEPVGWRFAGLLSLRTLAYVAFLWSFCFLMGFAGRFRTPLYLGFLIGLLTLAGTTELDLWKFGPLALISPTEMPFERNLLPWKELGESLFLTVVFAAAAWLAGTWKEGSLAETMAGRLSQKEKCLAALLIVLGMFATTIYDAKKAKPPYDLGKEGVLTSQKVPLHILCLDDQPSPAAHRLMVFLEEQLSQLQTTLAVDQWPPLRVICDPTLDGQTFDEGSLPDNEGVLLRCNFEAPDFDQRGFASRCLHDVLSNHTKGRAYLENRHWFLDGFGRWWVEREAATPALIPRALFAIRGGRLTAEQVRDWGLSTDRLGDRLAEALAYSGVLYLEQTRGREAVLELARSLYTQVSPSDSRQTVREWFYPFPKRFQKVCGVPWPEFVSGWAEQMEHWRRQNADLMTRLDSFQGRLEVRGDAIHYAFDVPSQQALACALVHAEVGPYDAYLPASKLLREEHFCRGSEKFQLDSRYTSGERIFCALEVDVPELGCPVRLVAGRWVVP
ncbi:MAG: hypothetical protein AB7S38_17595 [Vulcanimicrobiota bacterium]